MPWTCRCGARNTDPKALECAASECREPAPVDVVMRASGAQELPFAEDEEDAA